MLFPSDAFGSEQRSVLTREERDGCAGREKQSGGTQGASRRQGPHRRRVRKSRMDNRFNPYEFEGENSQANLESQQWQYPLSANLDEIDFVTSDQTNQNVGVQGQTPFRPPRPQQPTFDSVQGSQGMDDSVVHVPAPQARKVNKGKKVSQRGKAFSKEEDRMICSAFINVSKDPVTGTNQSSGGYYKRLHDYFHEHLEMPSGRSVVAIQHRWLSIQKAVNKFCGFFSIVERRNESGKTEQNRIDDAAKMFEESEPWTFIHCWNVLRHEPKWNERMVEINTIGTATRVNQRLACNIGGEPIPSENADNGELARPEGRDSAKKRRSRGGADTSASSTAIEVLQRMHERGQLKDDKEDTQMAQILQRKDAKIELQQNLISL